MAAVISSTGYVRHSHDNAVRTIDKVLKAVDTYWTPFEGHKISLRSTNEKLVDWLLVARSGLRTACSEAEKLQWFMLECTLLSIRQQINV